MKAGGEDPRSASFAGEYLLIGNHSFVATGLDVNVPLLEEEAMKVAQGAIPREPGTSV